MNYFLDYLDYFWQETGRGNTFKGLKKVPIRIYKLVCFSQYHAHIFEKDELDFLLQNWMVNRYRLAPISNTKSHTQKSLYALF